MNVKAFAPDCYGWRMRPLAYVVPVALLSLVTACASTSPRVEEPSATPTPSAAPPASAPATTAATAPATGAPTSAAAGGQTLTGELGANNAFTITLVDAAGKPVTTLKAGTYQVKIKDTSAIHNFHLSGPGVEQTTTVPEIKEVTWTVTFKPGTHTYVCDPHPSNMKKTFTVT
jgi:plastocyanin